MIPKHNLPVQASPLIGREQDLVETRSRLLSTDVRLLTLVGTGGTGKTHLALAVARDLLGDFAQGVFLVDLSPLREVPLVLPAIARTIGVLDGHGAGSDSLFTRIRRALRQKPVLLVLDNVEHLLPAGPQVGELLEGCPHLKVLATSREPLRLRWEHVFRVSPLTLPDLRRMPVPEELTQVPAVTLFVQRSQRVNPDFVLNERNAAAVAELCVRLDGLPLAIELAAGRSRLLSPQAMVTRLQRRFDLLTSGAQDQPRRHQTLRAAVDWSYDLLLSEEQALFRRLSVFLGGWTLEAAEAVAAAAMVNSFEALAALLDKGLVRSEEQPDGEPRFRMLETLCEYALARLDASGETEPTRQRHADHYLRLAEEAEPPVDGARAGGLVFQAGARA